MAKIRNKKTGEIREVQDSELAKYGLRSVKKYPWGGLTQLIGKGQGTGITDMMDMFRNNQNQGITAPGNLPDLQMMEKIPSPDLTREPNKDLATSDSNPAPTKKGNVDWTQLGNQFKSMFQNQQSPNIPSFGIQGNRYFSQSGDQFGKFMEAGAESGKAFASGDYIRGAKKAAQSIAHSHLQKINMAKGILDWIGTENQNSRALKKEADLRRQSIFNDEENLPPIESYGYSVSGRNNPLVMRHGGDIKVPREFANAEFENKEIVQLPDGFVDSIYGNTHANGGIAVNAPNNTRVFSEALKEPTTKKSYAKLASKYKTKKDFDNVAYANSDNISKATSGLSIRLKNEALDDLFHVQEMRKLQGDHGVKAQKAMLEEFNAKFGGLKRYDGTDGAGWVGQRFKTPMGIITPTGTDLNKDPLSDWENWRKKYAGKDNRITKKQTPEAIAALQENIYDDYLGTPEGQEALIKMWQEHGINIGVKGFKREQYEDIAKKIKNKEKLTLDDLNRLRGNYIDGLSGKRLPEVLQQKATQVTPPTLEVKKGDDVPTIEQTPFTPTPVGRKQKTGLNFFIPQPYERDPLHTKTLKPEYINPRYLDIQPELQDVEWGYNAFQSNLGSRTGSDISNLLQAQANSYLAKNKARNAKYNYDRQQDSQAQQFNAQAKMNTDQINLNEFVRFNDAISKREGLLDTQKRIDYQAAIQNQIEQERFAQQQAIIEELFRPSLKNNSQAFVYKLPKNSNENKKDKKKRS